jgi:LacI family transcriptional regulator
MAGRDGSATIRDVARVAGVSVSTVSRVLNGKTDVAERTRQAVYEAMDAISYTVSPVALSLVGARTRLLGVLARHLSEEFSTALIRGIFEVGEREGYDVFLTASLRSRDRTAALLRSVCDGLIVVSPGLDTEPDLALLEKGRPVVFFERHESSPESALVTTTNRQGVSELIRHLVGLGHRRIGFVTGRMSLPSSRERLEGYREALDEAGILHDPSLIIEGSFDRQSGLLAGRTLLGLPARPTAIVASNDLEAFGVLLAAQEAGLRVPDQLSVAGFDDIPMSEHVHPPLTTVHQPMYEMGVRAARMLIGWVEGERPEPSQVVLPTHLVIRGSSGPPATP